MTTSLRLGRGRAHGAITVLNATATGFGCSLATHAATTATWQWTGDAESHIETGGAGTGLVEAVAHRMAAHLGLGDAGARVNVQAPFPPSRGLKTSSSAAAALVRAAFDSAGAPGSDADVERLAVECSRDAGVTLTGAFDDQVAVTRGGCHVTDNRRLEVVASVAVEPWHVAVWVPAASIPKSRLRDLDATPLAQAADNVKTLILQGDVAKALTDNGRLFTRFYAAAGLPVSEQPALTALRAGALGAGLSGTGPAVAALFAERVPLEAVAGGTWTWSRAEVGR